LVESLGATTYLRGKGAITVPWECAGLFYWSAHTVVVHSKHVNLKGAIGREIVTG